MEETNNNLVINISETDQYVNQNWFRQQIHFNQKKLLQTNHSFTSEMANSQDDDESGSQRKKPSSRDPLSHRIIEKRRRDRMNNCLADLSRLIPTSYLKKGRGRIEKTEIIEMAIKHMKHLQAHKYCSDDSKCGLANAPHLDHEERQRQYRLGYQECLSEAVRFLVEIEGLFTGDGLCRRMMDYLYSHMTARHKVSPYNESEVCPDDPLTKARSPSLSESTTSANEKMDINDNDSNDGTLNSKPVITSHLREMLESTSKHKRTPNNSFSSSPSLSPNNCHQNSEVYNFKKEIKERFQADQKVMNEPLKSISPSNLTIDDERISNSSLSSLTTQTSDHRSETSGYSSNCSNKSPIIPSIESSVDAVVVPIFALHPSGNYYLPLTLEASLIAPHLNLTKEADLKSFPILHPINITVNFSYQMSHLDTNRPVWPPIMPSFMAQNLNLTATQMPTFSLYKSITNDNQNNKINFNNNALQENNKFVTIGSNSLSTASKLNGFNKIKLSH